MTDLKKFLKENEACEEGYEWAMSTGCNTVEELWERDDLRGDWRIWIATKDGFTDHKTLIKWSCWCVRQIWHLLKDERSKKAVETVEAFIDGKATIEDVSKTKNTTYNKIDYDDNGEVSFSYASYAADAVIYVVEANEDNEANVDEEAYIVSYVSAYASNDRKKAILLQAKKLRSMVSFKKEV